MTDQDTGDGEQGGAISIAIIRVERYRCPDGRPTCCSDHPAGKVCRFLGVRSFGQRDVCMLGAHVDLHKYAPMGYTIPHKACEVWKDESK